MPRTDKMLIKWQTVISSQHWWPKLVCATPNLSFGDVVVLWRVKRWEGNFAERGGEWKRHLCPLLKSIISIECVCQNIACHEGMVIAVNHQRLSETLSFYNFSPCHVKSLNAHSLTLTVDRLWHKRGEYERKGEVRMSIPFKLRSQRSFPLLGSLSQRRIHPSSSPIYHQPSTLYTRLRILCCLSSSSYFPSSSPRPVLALKTSKHRLFEITLPWFSENFPSFSSLVIIPPFIGPWLLVYLHVSTCLPSMSKL